jgi:RNA-binding protein
VRRAMPPVLTSRDRARLKAQAHQLDPIARIGRAGLTDAFVAEVDRALTDHELIKVWLDGDDREARQAAADEICARTDAAPVQLVGRVLVLWRPKPEEPGGDR